MAKFTQQERSRLVRSFQRQSPQHSEAQRIVASRTSRDNHPTQGSAAIAQMVGSGKLPAVKVSLNVTVDGTSCKSFMWGVAGFGWGSGVLN